MVPNFVDPEVVVLVVVLLGACFFSGSADEFGCNNAGRE